MKTTPIFIGAIATAFMVLCLAMQTAQDKREKGQTKLLIDQVRLVADNPPSNPTPTPPHSTMHVTQRIQTDPSIPPHVLAVLAKQDAVRGREWPDTIERQGVVYFQPVTRN